MAINPLDTLYALSSAYIFSLGAFFWYKYPHYVETNDQLFDRWDASPIITQLDKTWARDTKEISRWTMTSYMLLASGGIQWFSWLMNKATDNEGGDVHELYLRISQVGTYFVPGMLFVQFARLYNAYNRTIAIDTTEYSVYCGDSRCTQGRTFFNFAYVPGENDFTITQDNHNYEVRIADNEQYNNLALFFFSILLSLSVSQRSIGAIKAEFDAARLGAKTEGSYEEPTTAAEEEEVIEETFF
jgi:hypothetical protein